MLEDLSHWLQDGAQLTVQEWASETFPSSGFVLDDLLRAADGCHYAVMILAPDDQLLIDGKSPAVPVSRDNVIFEAGLFTGKLARDRVFYWVNNADHTLRIPTDLHGLTQHRYDFNPSASNSRKEQIRQKARNLKDQICADWKVLLARGDQSTLDAALMACFKREWIIRPPLPPPLVFAPRRELLDREDVYDSLVASSTAPTHGIVIVDRDTKWVWDLFPLLLRWALDGVEVTVITSKPHNNAGLAADEQLRHALLTSFGCHIIQADVSKRMYLIDPIASADTVAFLFEHELERVMHFCRASYRNYSCTF